MPVDFDYPDPTTYKKVLIAVPVMVEDHSDSSQENYETLQDLHNALSTCYEFALDQAYQMVEEADQGPEDRAGDKLTELVELLNNFDSNLLESPVMSPLYNLWTEEREKRLEKQEQGELEKYAANLEERYQDWLDEKNRMEQGMEELLDLKPEEISLKGRQEGKVSVYDIIKGRFSD